MLYEIFWAAAESVECKLHALIHIIRPPFPIRHDFHKPFCDTFVINVSIVTKVFDVEIRNSYSSVCFDIGLPVKSFSVHYVQLKVCIKRMQHFLFDFETRFTRFVLELTCELICERLLQLR